MQFWLTDKAKKNWLPTFFRANIYFHFFQVYLINTPKNFPKLQTHRHRIRFIKIAHKKPQLKRQLKPEINGGGADAKFHNTVAHSPQEHGHLAPFCCPLKSDKKGAC
jgi:hypothetical protein